jgi:hypothetical protein
MMQAAAEVTRGWQIPTVASLNPIMIDGIGMCGGCRVAVGGVTRFACVEGPEFDAHQVDFEDLARRNRAYSQQERQALLPHECKLAGAVSPPGSGAPDQLGSLAQHAICCPPFLSPFFIVRMFSWSMKTASPICQLFTAQS